jgi:Tfp pilus assembly protein PilV
MDFVPVLTNIVKSWAPSLVTVILIPLIMYLTSQIQKNGKDDAERYQQLKQFVSDQIKSMKDEMEKRLDDYGRRLSCLEMDTVKKDEYYRENSGWRAELYRLSDQITNMLKEFPKMIIELWKEGPTK